MTEDFRDDSSLSINEKIEISSIKEVIKKEFEQMNKKIEKRDDLLIMLTKEIACLRNDINVMKRKFEKESSA